MPEGCPASGGADEAPSSRGHVGWSLNSGVVWRYRGGCSRWEELPEQRGGGDQWEHLREKACGQAGQEHPLEAQPAGLAGIPRETARGVGP